jgi:hypothetical protein
MNAKQFFLGSTSLRRSNYLATVLLVALLLVVMACIGWYASHPYVIDIIGRTNLISALELGKGRPIYGTPATGGAVSMSYTPGFPLLAALIFNTFGYSRWIWSLTWASVDFAFLGLATAYLFHRSRWLSVLVPASMLGCLFPVVWARADIAAIGFFWFGWIILDPTSQKKTDIGSIQRLLCSAAFSISIFFKQTMLPAALIAVLIYAIESPGIQVNQKAVCFLKLLASMALCMAAIFIPYLVFFRESPVLMAQVMTLGRDHDIRAGSFLQYLIIYAIATAAPTVVLIRHARSRRPLAFLHVLGMIFILFASKSGGSWHHLMPLLLPWCGYLLDSTEGKARFGFFGIAFPVLLLCIIGFAASLRPALASAGDIESAKDLRSVLVGMAPRDGDILVLDTRDNFAFPDAQYEFGFKTKWDRGALEEWSAAMGRTPDALINQISNSYFQGIIFRGNPQDFLPASAYGVPYKDLHNVIFSNYMKCREKGASNLYWVAYCPKNRISRN